MLALAVSAKVHLALERLLAEAAREGLVPGVFPHVRDDVGRLGEGLAADGTLVRLLACGEADTAGQMGQTRSDR